MSFNKAKQIILSEARKLRMKAEQKEKEAAKLITEAIELETKAEEM